MTKGLSFIFLTGVFALAGCVPSEADRKSLSEAFTKYDARQLDDVERLTTTYIEKFPNEPDVDEAYYLRGLAKYGKGDKPGASQDLQIAAEKSKRGDLKGKSYLLLGDIAHEGRRWEQSLDYYKKAMENYPAGEAPVIVYYRIGTCLQAMGDWEKAKPYFTKTLALKPDDVLRARAVQRLNATFFELQFAAIKDGPKAGEYARSLQSQGIDAMIKSELREGQFLFLVRWGKFKTFDEAEFARSRLLAKNPLVIVVP